MDKEIKENQIYTTEEAQEYLRVSQSTIKRLLKKGILRANKVGGRYKIMGSEILRVVSPKVETKARHLYFRLKDKTQNVIKKW
jgi:excisionase family DNA binding protein